MSEAAPRYILVAAYEPDLLAQRVNHWLDQGYELAGALIAQEVGGPLIQPMLRAVSEERDP